MSPLKMTSMGYGKRYALKTSKEDEQNPGPKYNDKTKTINDTLSTLTEKRGSTFGLKEQVVYDKSQQRVLYGKETPGPGVYEQ
jgi:hypothetical protein